jgi:hypothetical protein
MRIRWLFLPALLGAVLAHAAEDKVEVFGAHPGYLFDVDDERDRVEVEMVMLDKPKPPPGPPVKPVFDAKLSKEVQLQYQNRFGSTAAEQVINNPARDQDYTYQGANNSISLQQYQDYQHQFGNYVIRRTVEYHFDNWFKNDPQFKPIYDTKERFSNLNVQVKKGWKVKWKYNFAGPMMELNLDNPYNVGMKVQLLMTGLVSSPNDEIVTLDYQLSPKVHLQLLRHQAWLLTQFVISRTMTKHISTSLTFSSGQEPWDLTIHEDRAILGFGYAE